MVKKSKASLIICSLHCFEENEKRKFQDALLTWYSSNHRVLPWRSIAAEEENSNKRAYAVWVSEMMLQQTQVSTVINYYKQWMLKWPTVESLAQGTLEEVNEVWAGLGYYSRAKRLHEGAVKITENLNGEFPKDRESLEKELPGVGRYTASAIASIAMKQPVGVVDGNVLRVMSRVRAIGGDISSQDVVEHIWKLADDLVDEENPADFNQAMMEIGATVCIPKNPSCKTCPLSKHCVSFNKFSSMGIKNILDNALNCKSEDKDRAVLHDLECDPNCDLCLKEKYDISLGVQNYPRKSRKTLVKNITSAIILLHNETCIPSKYLLVQRPTKGLLANLWEFINIELIIKEKSTSQEENVNKEENESRIEDLLTEKLMNNFKVGSSLSKSRKYISDVTHIFSHINQTYKVYEIKLKKELSIQMPENYQGLKWMSEEEFFASATSTAMKKVFKAFQSSLNKGVKSESKKRKQSEDIENGKQRKIFNYFNPVVKKSV